MKIHNIKELKKGMRIQISDDPSYSIKRHGALKGFKKMLAGTIQEIQSIDESRDRIYIVPPPRCTHDTISFNICDLRKIGEGYSQEKIQNKNIKPILFDPKQLDI